jgi:hypothetical protein
LLPDDYAVCRLEPGAALPDRLISGDRVFSVTVTPDEVSVICPVEQAPSDAVRNTPWRCLRVAGPVDLALTGILASLVNPLASASVNVFAFSTFETDYLLVPAVRLGEALGALAAAGHRIATPATP